MFDKIAINNYFTELAFLFVVGMDIVYKMICKKVARSDPCQPLRGLQRFVRHVQWTR